MTEGNEQWLYNSMMKLYAEIGEARHLTRFCKDTLAQIELMPQEEQEKVSTLFLKLLKQGSKGQIPGVWSTLKLSFEAQDMPDVVKPAWNRNSVTIPTKEQESD